LTFVKNYVIILTWIKNNLNYTF